MKTAKLALLIGIVGVLLSCASAPGRTGRFGVDKAAVDSSAIGTIGSTKAEPIGSWYLAFAAVVPAFRFHYEIAPWPGFKTTAYTITFDDGTYDQYALAFPALEKRGFKATYFLITGLRDEGYWNDSGTKRALFSWDEAREMAQAGHEMASHTATHRDLSAIPASRFHVLEEELLSSIEAIEREIPDGTAGRLTFAWPYWRSTGPARELAERFFLAARSGMSSIESYLSKPERASWKTPPDGLALPAATMRAKDTEEALNDLRIATEHAGGWNILSFHGIDDGDIAREALGWDPCPLDRFEAILDALSSMDAYVAPAGEVIRYIRQRDAATLRLAALSGDRMLLHLIDGLNDEEFHLPLTLRFNIPEGWTNVRVLHNDKEIPIRMANGFCTIDAVPDGGLIVVKRD